MKTFKDLKFTKCTNGLDAKMYFENGYGISVIRFKTPYGYGSYTLNEKQWEIAVLRGEDICYDTPITDNVIGYLSAREVTKIMKQIQQLPKIEL